MLKQQVNICLLPTIQGDLVQQVGKLFLQIAVHKAAGLQLEGEKVENGRYRGRQIVGKEVPRRLKAGKGFLEEFVVGVGEFAHGGSIAGRRTTDDGRRRE